MPRKGLNIYKRNDGRWEGRYIKGYDEKGKAKYGYLYARTYNEVKKKLILAQVDIYAKGRSNGVITFYELSQKWLFSTKIKVKTSTYARYVNLLEQHILPELGGYKLNKLSNCIFDDFVNEKLETGKIMGDGGLSSKTVRDILSIIKSIVRFGEAEKLLQKDSLIITYPKNDFREMRVFTKEEQARLESILSEDLDINKLGILICMYTGIRIGEICALKWEDLKLENEVLLIRRTIQRVKNMDDFHDNKTRIIIDVPKTKCSIRDIPIPGFLVTEIMKFYRNNDKAFFLTGSEERFVEPRTYQNHFKTYVKAGDIDDINFHTLRHTFATRCIEMGFDIKSLSEILGHANVNITLNRYVHSSFKLKQDNMKKLYRINI